MLAVVILGVAIWQPWREGSAGDAGLSVTNKWYYDLQSHQLVSVGPDIGRPPVTLPSGGEAVEAHVFACGSCESETFIGHLERWSDEAKAYFDNPTDTPLDPATMQLVAAPPVDGAEPQWVSVNGPEAIAIVDTASRCAAGNIVQCYP